MKNELQKHKLSDKIKWVLTLIAFVLVFAVLAGLCMQLFAKDDKFKPSNWFAPVEQAQPDDGENETAVLSSPRAMAKTMSANVDENYEMYSNSNVDLGQLGADYTVVRLGDGDTVWDKILILIPYDVCDMPQGDWCSHLIYATEDGFSVWVAGMYDFGYFYNYSVYKNGELVFSEDVSANDLQTVSLSGYPSCFVFAPSFDLPTGCVVDYDTLVYFVGVPLPPDPVKEGHTFKGWYIGNGDYCDGHCTKYTKTVIYEDVDLHAHFSVNVYTVSYDSAGGPEVKSDIVEWGTQIFYGTFKRPGYTFLGWYYSNGVKYENQPITDDTTLTAHWEVIMCTVTFYVDGEVYETKQIAWGTALSGVADMAATMNLQLMSLSLADDGVIDEIVSGDLDVTAVIMEGADKVVNTVKNNKWQIVGGVAGGIALIAIIAAVCGGVKRKSK